MRLFLSFSDSKKRVVLVILENADYFVRLVDLPIGVHGFIVPNDDGTYSVYINSRDSSVRQRQACKHERKHIARNDFSRDNVHEAEGL